METKLYKYLTLALAAMAAVMLFAVLSRPAGATEVPPKCWEEEEVPEEPTCEELQNCKPEEPPVVETPKVDTPDAPKVRYSQGPHGVKGDGKCQAEWNKIKGSKKVEIRYAEDGIFGNGYKTLTTDDDGAEWLNADSGKMKLRGRDSKTDWSKAKSFSC